MDYSDYNGKVTMLAPSCDLDDMYSLQKLLHTLNRLEIPRLTYSSISRLRPSDSPNMQIFYTHTIKFI